MQSDNIKSVIIYCRESRDEGFENYDRIETQRDILVEFCKKQNLGQIIEIIMDDNKSGTNFDRLQPIKEKAARKEVDILLCKDASRLGRNILESLIFTEFLANHNVELVFESERYDEDMFPLIAWFNERRAKDDSTKIRRVLRHKMEEGSIVIKAPYGYRKEGNNLIVDKNIAPIIQEVFDLFINGETMCKIAYIMNTKGYPTPSQLKNHDGNMNQTQIWNSRHIARILKHRIYTGDMPYGMREKISYKSKKYKNVPQENWIIIANHHEAIISRKDFDIAQVKMKRYAGSKPRKSNDRTFSGLMFCARCGSRMLKIERETLRPSYVCGKSHREGSIKNNIRENYGCSPHRVFTNDLVNLIKQHIEKLLTASNLQDRLYQELDNCPSAENEISKQIKFCEVKISQLQKKASMIYDDKLNGTIPEYLFNQKLSAVSNELSTYGIKLKEHEQSLKELSGQTDLKYTIESVINEIHKSGINHATVSMLYKKILIYNPNEITDIQRQEYDLSDTEYNHLKINGGILFVQNYAYHCNMLNYELCAQPLSHTNQHL